MNQYDILTSSWPRFIWKVAFSYGIEELFDLIYDATDIPHGEAYVGCAKYIRSEDIELMLHEPLTLSYSAVLAKAKDGGGAHSFFLQTVRSINAHQNQFFLRLTDLYGEPRPPKKLNLCESNEFGPVHQETRKEIYLSSEQDLGCLDDLFGGIEEDNLIWVISYYGVLFIGKDIGKAGHPTLTGAEPARIAGEIHKVGQGNEADYLLNHKSGRYSTNYTEEDSVRFFMNAKCKIEELFPKHKFGVKEDDR